MSEFVIGGTLSDLLGENNRLKEEARKLSEEKDTKQRSYDAALKREKTERYEAEADHTELLRIRVELKKKEKELKDWKEKAARLEGELAEMKQEVKKLEKQLKVAGEVASKKRKAEETKEEEPTVKKQKMEPEQTAPFRPPGQTRPGQVWVDAAGATEVDLHVKINQTKQ